MFLRKHTTSLTFLAKGSLIKGDLNIAGNLRVDGTICGFVEVAGDLEVAADSCIEGSEIRAQNVIVHRVVKANLLLIN